MKALVTGGAGYIGRHLVQALLGKGHSVRVLDVLAGGLKEEENLELILGSIIDRLLVEEAMKDIETIFHLALVPGDWTVKDPKVFNANIIGLLNLLNSAEANHVKHFLLASSHVVYGRPRYLPIDENHPCHPEESLSVEGPAYPLIKLMTEKICRIHYLQYHLPITILRLSLVVGGEKPFPRGPTWLWMLDRARRGETIEVVEGEVVTGVDVDEVAEAFLLSATKSEAHGQTFNVANPRICRTHYEVARQAIMSVQSGSRIKVTKPKRLVNSMPYSIKKIQEAICWVPTMTSVS